MRSPQSAMYKLETPDGRRCDSVHPEPVNQPGREQEKIRCPSSAGRREGKRADFSFLHLLFGPSADWILPPPLGVIC